MRKRKGTERVNMEQKTNAEAVPAERPVRPAWPSEAEDRVNQLLGQLAAKELECQRLREALRYAAATERERIAKVCEATWEIDGSHTAAEFAAVVRAA